MSMATTNNPDQSGTSPTSSPASRRLLYGILITVAVAGVCGRILGVQNVYEPPPPDSENPLGNKHPSWPAAVDPQTGKPLPPLPVPTLGGNDRSRWSTVRALVDEGRYAIGWRIYHTPRPSRNYEDIGITFEDGWKTLDKVLHATPIEHDPEKYEWYSSKPPLLPTLLAGEYWLLKHTFGWSISSERWEVVRVILLTVNALPFLVYLVLLARLADRFGTTDWGRLFTVAAAGFATMMTPFAITLNNHTIATCCVVFALYPAVQIWFEGQREWWRFVLAGLFASFTATNELPAASFTAALSLALLWKAPKQTLLYYVPAAALPVIAFLLTNYLAIGQLRPAYGEFGGSSGSWYNYEGSYWTVDPNQPGRGIDRAGFKEDRATYAFHLLLGHHGWFSLFPVYFLGLAGLVVGLGALRGRTGSAAPPAEATANWFPLLALLTALLSVVIFGFYTMVVGDGSRNYGGMTCGPRWFMWLTPLWLLCMLPIVDRLGQQRWGRALAYLCLGVSVASASFPAWNPWRHPWLFRWLEASGWVVY